jgi:Chitobiase/beta-hexosaminidase C-terminal domain
MRRPSFIRLSIHGSAFPRLARVMARAPYELRRIGPVALVFLTVLALGIASLTADAVTHAWTRLSKSASANCPGCGERALHKVFATSSGLQLAAVSAPTITSFDAPGAGTAALQGTIGASINGGGDIAGVYLTAPNIAHGFLRAAATGTVTEFDAPGAGTAMNQGTFALSIDAADDIAGMYADSNNAYHGFVRAGATGTITQFDVPGAPTTIKHRGTSPVCINSAGVIAGMYVDANAVRHGFIRTVTNGTASFTTINITGAGTSATQGTIPMNIDAAGNITGFYIDANYLFHGFLRVATGTITAPIDAPGAGTVATGAGFTFAGTLPIGLDSSGDIGGVYADANSIFHGFVRAAGGTITSFDVPDAGTTGLFPGTVPISINGSGDITGIYEDVNGVNHGFIRAASDGTITAPVDAPGAGTSGMIAGTVPFSINATDSLTGGYADSNETFHGFVLAPAPAATPTFSPAAGTFSAAQTVTITDATAGAAIYYTTDGTAPTIASTLYAGVISVDSTETIKAIAAASGYSNSAVAAATYTITTAPPAATPTFSPAAGTYAAAQTVTISDTTAGATIYYTTNGNSPTTASTVYSGAITVSSTETIEAIAAATGFSNSPVATAAYAINLPAPDFQVSVNPSSLTIVAGQSGQAVFTVTPTNGFNSKVSFACTGLPPGAACSFNPPSVTPNGAAASSTLTVTTTAPSVALPPLMPSSQLLAYAFVFAVLSLLFGIGVCRRHSLSGLRFLVFLSLLVAASGVVSCSGHGSSGTNSGTPAGTSMVSVSASAGGGGVNNHSATLTITITN